MNFHEIFLTCVLFVLTLANLWGWWDSKKFFIQMKNEQVEHDELIRKFLKSV